MVAWGEKIPKGHKETFGRDGYVHYLDCGDGSTGVYRYPKQLTVHFKYMQFILCQYNMFFF